ncbi:hypothetical protein PR048_029651 [Dryococelus australis]|uniref:Solute carrier family 40 protein n=1 Tax=Dryococelus australis TaxID=614101 RepID=A0ABQ9GG15_9NEOP|nr:hypothetical protein PR048_029651 [Dryococelus australis]
MPDGAAGLWENVQFFLSLHSGSASYSPHRLQTSDDLFAVSLVMPLMSTHLRSLGASHFLIGLLGSTYSCLQLFSGPVVGSWSDIRGRRAVLLFTKLFEMYGCLACWICDATVCWVRCALCTCSGVGATSGADCAVLLFTKQLERHQGRRAVLLFTKLFEMYGCLACWICDATVCWYGVHCVLAGQLERHQGQTAVGATSGADVQYCCSPSYLNVWVFGSVGSVTPQCVGYGVHCVLAGQLERHQGQTAVGATSGADVQYCCSPSYLKCMVFGSVGSVTPQCVGYGVHCVLAGQLERHQGQTAVGATSGADCVLLFTKLFEMLGFGSVGSVTPQCVGYGVHCVLAGQLERHQGRRQLERHQGQTAVLLFTKLFEMYGCLAVLDLVTPQCVGYGVHCVLAGQLERHQGQTVGSVTPQCVGYGVHCVLEGELERHQGQTVGSVTPQCVGYGVHCVLEGELERHQGQTAVGATSGADMLYCCSPSYLKYMVFDSVGSVMPQCVGYGVHCVLEGELERHQGQTCSIVDHKGSWSDIRADVQYCCSPSYLKCMGVWQCWICDATVVLGMVCTVYLKGSWSDIRGRRSVLLFTKLFEMYGCLAMLDL